MKSFRTWLAALLGLMVMPVTAAEPMLSPEDRGYLNLFVSRLVWGGFDSQEDIREAAIYQTEPPVQGTADLEWLDQQIEQEWSKKRAAEAKWPMHTDFVKLDEAFKTLRAKGILALHNAGNTQSDARDDASQEWHRLGGTNSGLKGFVFYHSQDVENVIANGNLYIGFATFPGGSATAREIVEQTVAALKAAGFTVESPPDAGTRILVTGIDWKKRSQQ